MESGRAWTAFWTRARNLALHYFASLNHASPHLAMQGKIFLKSLPYLALPHHASPSLAAPNPARLCRRKADSEESALPVSGMSFFHPVHGMILVKPDHLEYVQFSYTEEAFFSSKLQLPQGFSIYLLLCKEFLKLCVQIAGVRP